MLKIEEAEGNGPVDAVFNCIKALVPHEAKLELYQVHAVTEGTDAQAEVSVRLAHEGRSMTARAADPDTLVASAKAYLGALEQDRHEARARHAGAGMLPRAESAVFRNCYAQRKRGAFRTPRFCVATSISRCTPAKARWRLIAD